MLRLQDAISLINDLDENLHIFDIKLRHMREDIAAIEARNNRLAQPRRMQWCCWRAAVRLLNNCLGLRKHCCVMLLHACVECPGLG